MSEEEVSSEHLDICDVCEQPAFHQCSGCRSAVYCSEKCQAQEWAQDHKDICHLLIECGVKKEDYYDSASDEYDEEEQNDDDEEEDEYHKWKKSGGALADRWRAWRLRKSLRKSRRERRKARRERRKERWRRLFSRRQTKN